MRNIWLVAQQEFLTNIRKRSFLFAVFGIPVLMGVIFALVFFVQIEAIEGGIVAENIGYVEQMEVISLESQTFTDYETVGAATAALDAEEVDVFFVITPFYFSTGEIRLYSYGSVSFETREAIEVFLVENLTSTIVTDAPAERLIDPVDFALYLENRQRELSFEGMIGLFIVPVLFAVVLMVALQLTSSFLMAGVVEEKSNHIMEILITSITPYELLAGKLLGLGTLGLLQMLVWLIMGIVGIQFSGNLGFLSAVVLPADFIIIVLLYFLLTYFLYASLLAGVGAIMGSEQESRTIAGLALLPNAIPMMLLSVLIFNPDSPIFTVLTYIPFTAGMTYMVRYPFTEVPIWEVLISLSILAVSTVIMTWATAKVFRWALLLYGKKPGVMTLWRVIRGKEDMGVVPAHSTDMEAKA